MGPLPTRSFSILLFRLRKRMDNGRRVNRTTTQGCERARSRINRSRQHAAVRQRTEHVPDRSSLRSAQRGRAWHATWPVVSSGPCNGLRPYQNGSQLNSRSRHVALPRWTNLPLPIIARCATCRHADEYIALVRRLRGELDLAFRSRREEAELGHVSTNIHLLQRGIGIVHCYSRGHLLTQSYKRGCVRPVLCHSRGSACTQKKHRENDYESDQGRRNDEAPCSPDMEYRSRCGNQHRAPGCL